MERINTHSLTASFDGASSYLVPNEKNVWNIRSEDRKKALILIKRIFKWQLGVYEFAEDEIEELKDDWKFLLVPALDESRIQDLWDEIISGVNR